MRVPPKSLPGDAFYLKPLQKKPNDSQKPWFTTHPVGKNKINSMVKHRQESHKSLPDGQWNINQSINQLMHIQDMHGGVVQLIANGYKVGTTDLCL